MSVPKRVAPDQPQAAAALQGGRGPGLSRLDQASPRPPTDGPEALDALYRHLGDELLAFFLRRVDEATAHDLRQETFLRLHRGLPTLRDSDRVAGFAFRTARNLLIDHYRRQRPTDALDLESHPHDEEPLFDEEVSVEVAAWLPGFLALLDDPSREALELAELEGLSMREVAERLGLSVSGAKSRVQRGRKKLRAALEACCAIEVDARGRVTDYTPRDPCGC